MRIIVMPGLLLYVRSGGCLFILKKVMNEKTDKEG